MTKRVLIVDDEEVFSKMLAEFLDGKGLECEICHSGHRVVRKLFEHKFDLVVLDVWMVELGGVEVYQKIRKVDAELPVMMMSGYASSELLRKLDALKVNRFIRKPFTLTDFWDACLELIESREGASSEGGADAASDPSSTPDPSSKYRLLIADDDPAYLDVLSEMFTTQGYHVACASNGQEALQRFREHPEVNTVILDVDMPGKSGVEVLREIRKSRPDILAIIITALQDESLHRQLMDYEGAFAVFEKPFSMQHFLRFVETSEQIKRMSEEEA